MLITALKNEKTERRLKKWKISKNLRKQKILFLTAGIILFYLHCFRNNVTIQKRYRISTENIMHIILVIGYSFAFW